MKYLSVFFVASSMFMMIALRVPIIILVFKYTKKILNSNNKHEQQFYVELIVKLVKAFNIFK